MMFFGLCNARAKTRAGGAPVDDKRSRRGQRSRRGDAGFTLIELMISLLIASIMVGLVFAIYTRMSVAYRGQSAVSELQQALRAAKDYMGKHVRAAGYMIPNGFEFAGAAGVVPPVVMDNDPAAGDATFNPDELRVYYADPSAMAKIVSPAANNPYPSVSVDDVDEFAVGDVAVIVRLRALSNGVLPGDAKIAEYDACVVQITGVTAGAPGTIDLAGSAAAYNTATNAHCEDVLSSTSSLGTAGLGAAMMYRFVGRAFRIDPDPARRSLALLQVSPSGGLVANDWEDMGVGFTDLQIAVRYFENGDLLDSDGDGDAVRDWYSGVVVPPPAAMPMEVSVSLAVRTVNQVNLVATGSTPEFTEGNPDHNRLGDSPSIPLAGVPDAARPAQYQGNHIYRWASMRLDLRNLGVGR
jgi:prepilin-type N-terminal cleavage/methylation domain-containing protein